MKFILEKEVNRIQTQYTDIVIVRLVFISISRMHKVSRALL